MGNAHPPKILFIDIETAPSIGYTWGPKWETSIIEFVDDWYILCYGYKWLGEKTRVVALPDFPGYKPGGKDAKLLRGLWKLLDEADIVVAHNGDKFDLPKINTRFLINKMGPPSPYRTVDTRKVARRFGFLSNKLNDLGKDLGEGEKVKHTGFDLWKGCMSGDKHSWDLMKRYNKQDVDLLERIYLRFRPTISNHPNLSSHLGSRACYKCGHNEFIKRGFCRTLTSVSQKLQCKKCNGWCKEVINGTRTAQAA